MSKIIKKQDYNSLLDRVSALIEEARREAVKQVNTIIVQTYWEIGSLVVEGEQKGKERADYGTALIVKLSKDMMKRYGKGFSKSNLFLMRKFYITYPPKKFQTVSGKFNNGEFLSWSHYCELITIKDDLARSFYEIESIKNNWSVREYLPTKKELEAEIQKEATRLSLIKSEGT